MQSQNEDRSRARSLIVSSVDEPEAGAVCNAGDDAEVLVLGVKRSQRWNGVPKD